MNVRSLKMHHVAWMVAVGTLLAACCPEKMSSAEPSQASDALVRVVLAHTSAPATLPSGVYNWDKLTVQNTNVGQRRSLFDSPTATVNQLEFHITTLNPGQPSHEPHRHPNEELVMLKEGTLEAFINGKTIPMPTGSVLFLAPNDLHAVRNIGTTPATYFVVTWRTPKTGAAQ